jgi:undecaprenyl-diphosphatase
MVPPRVAPLLRRIPAAVRAIVDRLGVRLAVGLVAALIVLALFQVLSRSVARGGTDAFDGAVRSFVNDLSSPAATGTFRHLTDLGSPRLLVPFTVAAAAGFLWLRRRRAAILIVVTMLGVVFLDHSLKLVFQRTRPVPFFGLETPSSYSFPSGHSLASFCFYGALAALVAVRTRRLALRVLIWISGAAVILTVGLSRIYLGVHYPSDVLAGYAAGFVWVVAVASGDRFFRRTADTPAHRAPAAEAPVPPA